MLEQFQDVCNNLRDEKEIAIIEKYGSKAKCYTTVFILLGILNKCNLAVVQILPYIQHIVLPKNESRLNPSVYVATEYFTDREKYFYLTTLHTLAASYVGNALMIATGTMLIAYIQHICGMFSIASYRIEQAMNILQKDILKSENKVYKEIAYAVDIHRKAMEFADILISNFGGPYFFMIMFGLIGVSLSLYREITDHNEYVFVTVYNVPWYVSPLHIQRIILFLLQRGIKAFQIIIGGIFVANMESAAAVLSTSISYFTVLYSMREN